MRFKITGKNIVSIGYCPLEKVLEVEFKFNNAVYRYLNVPEDIWYKFKNVCSKEDFFNTEIAGCYQEENSVEA